MSETVYILGAGASVAAGAPLMNNFLGALRDVNLNEDSEGHKRDIERVLVGYQKIRVANSIFSMNYEQNIEEVFSSFEMIRLLGLDLLEGVNGQELIETLRRVIAYVIQNTTRFPIESSTEKGLYFRPPEYILRFLRAVRDYYRTHNPNSDISIITFNYDLLLDYALTYMNAPFSYCLSKDDNKKISLLKLHGSINWGKCNNCGKVVPYNLDLFFKNNPITSENDHYIKIIDYLQNIKHCNKPLQNTPFLVPPTWNKTEFHESISNVWNKAANELKNARRVVICGYSIPNSDPFFHHLLALALSQGAILDEILVVNPSEDPYKNLISRIAPSLAKLIHHREMNFEASYGFAFDKDITIKNKQDSWVY